MTLDDWREVIELDLTGQFLCCREVVRRFRAQDMSCVLDIAPRS
jgi:glucose 1-dehydrogenase